MTSSCPTMESSQSSATHIANITATSPSVDLTGTEGRDDLPSLDVLDLQVRRLLDKLAAKTFDSISDQIIEWANKSEKGKDGKMFSRVVQLVFERAVDHMTSSEVCARLCHKMVERVSEESQDHGVLDAEGRPIVGGQLLRELLLSCCQDFSERIWAQGEITATAVAALKATEGEAVKATNGKNKIGETGEVAPDLDEYRASQKAKRQNLGLVRFITELFKMQMLTELVMHEHLKKLLSKVNDAEEKDIEGLCTILTKVGSTLDTQKAHARMDVYFQRIMELAKSPNVSPRMQSMLQDVIKLRENQWMVARNAVPPKGSTRKEKKEKYRKAKKDEIEKRGEEEEKEQNEEDDFKQREEGEHEGSCRKGKGKAANSDRITEVDQAKGGELQAVDAPEDGDPSREAPKKRPGPLDLSASRSFPEPCSFAATTARVIEDLTLVSYPDGISGPKPELNVDAKDGKFRYDRDFLMQFMGVCQDKPGMLPPLSTFGLKPVDGASNASGSRLGRPSARR